MLVTAGLSPHAHSERGLTIGDFIVPIGSTARARAYLRHIALVCLGAALVGVTANLAIAVPGTPIPVTAQTGAVLLVGGALGLRRGLLAVLAYCVLGLFLPVYAGHAQGAATFAALQNGSIVLGAAGGYLVGFVLAAALVGCLAARGWDRNLGGGIVAMALGNVVIYLIGLPWLALALHLSPAEAIAQGLMPFVAGDAIKLAIASGILPFAWWLVGRRTTGR